MSAQKGFKGDGVAESCGSACDEPYWCLGRVGHCEVFVQIRLSSGRADSDEAVLEEAQLFGLVCAVFYYLADGTKCLAFLYRLYTADWASLYIEPSSHICFHTSLTIPLISG